MLGIFSKKSFMPHRQLRGTINELHWWLHAHGSRPPIPIPHHPHIVDHQAFLDASTSHSLAVIIGDKWHAWRLYKHWKNNGQDIGWAESMAFEFLIHILLTLNQSSMPLTAYCNNQGVVNSWKKGRSWNTPINIMFRRMHNLLAPSSCWIFVKYITSADNPADRPLHGRYPPTMLLLPQISISKISNYILKFDDPRCSTICV